MKAPEIPGDQTLPALPNAAVQGEVPAPWEERLQAASRQREALGLQRSIAPPSGADACSNDYLGLRCDDRLIQAGAEAARAFGAGSGAARLLRGTSPLHDRLEAALAAWKHQESCLLFNTGFQANATLIPALASSGDGVFSDALNHASLVDGCRMAKAGGAHVGIYRHRDLADLRAQMRAWRTSTKGLALVVTDSVFSMDGDAADLPGLLELCRELEALLLVDEAHATGLLGATGAGLAEQQGVAGAVPLVMGTLGKALGGFGAFVAGPRLLRDHLVNTARGFIFSTALPPFVLGSALQAVAVAQAERWRATRALGFAAGLRQALRLPMEDSAIVPVMVGDDHRALRMAADLQRTGFDVRAVRPPTVPPGTSRLRITTGAHLEATQVARLIRCLQELP